ncbi:tetratricopeptide repeat protein [Streptomyces sp. NPDC093595]|uniref:tetratricopeptide repeat protein n=1 Tax=Streptomyces sp. NPDC093595 TaxID=3366045 RepID=UPI0037F42311
MPDETSRIAATAHRLMDAASEGDPAAAEALREALPSLRSAAEAGDLEAQEVLGGVLLEWEQNPAEAASWFRRAAERGSAVGKRSLAYLYVNGLGVEEDAAAAERLFREAADAGDAYAQFNLARMWWGERDPQAVAALLRAAAEGGVTDAYVVLGDLLGAMDQDTEALHCYLMAARAGDDRGMYVAACWYRDGRAGRRDTVEALRWFFAMIEAGNADGLHEAITMARGMTDEEIRRAGELAGQPGSAEAMVDTVRKYR